MNYCFDSINGDNACSGNGPTNAWRDFTPLKNHALHPGDRLLLKRGSHFHDQLRVAAVGTSDAWIRITAYGQGPRPVLEVPRPTPCGEISHTGTMDASAPCVYITDAAYLEVSHLTVYNACYGLLINNYRTNRSNILVEDVIALDIHNNGQDDPRVNAAGIEVVVGRGHECRDVKLDHVTIRNCECYRTGTGVSTRAYGEGCAIEELKVEKVTSHDHANTPWSYVGLFIRGVRHGLYDGICLDRCAPHWKPTGTATVHYVRSDHIVFRNGYIGHTQDTDSHDMGAWDFEAGGKDCLIEHCTFEDNAGPAVEYLRCEDTARDIEIRDCTFIDEDRTRWGGGSVLHVGRSGPDPTGTVHDNHYVLVPGTRFGGDGFFALHNNTEYPHAAELPPHPRPPVVDAGPDQALTQLNTHLSGHVSNADHYRWEAVIAPGEVTFDDPDSLETDVSFATHGTYVLRLFAENAHMIYGSYVTLRCKEAPDDDLIPLGHEQTEIEAVDPGRTFSICFRLLMPDEAPGQQVFLANTAPEGCPDGFRLYAETTAHKGATLVLETGNGTDRDRACTTPGILIPGAWHTVIVTLDCTSQDGRGEARFYVNGVEATCFSGVQSDMKTRAPLLVGARAADSATTGDTPHPGDGPPSDLAVPTGFRLAFADTFAGGIEDDWRILSGTWHVRNGQLINHSKGELLCTRRFPEDVLLTYEACTDSATPCDLSAALNALPESGTMHGYFFGFGTDGNRGSRFLRRTGPIADAPARIVSGKVHQVACVRTGGTLQHIVDGQEVLRYEDARPLSGGRQPYVTLYVHAGGWFRNVRVYARPYAGLSQTPFTGILEAPQIHRRALSAGEAVARTQDQGHRGTPGNVS